MGEEIFVKLRYCFAGGYTLPQYCIDKGIKKPLFVLEKSSEWFLREIYAQFRYNEQILERYCFVDGDEKGVKLNLYHSMGLFWVSVMVENFFVMNLDAFDKIIFLTKEKINISNKNIITFTELEKFFIQRTCVDIPLLNFLQRYPKVKLILTNFPSIRRYKGFADFSSQLWSANALLKLLRAGKSVKTPFDKFGYTSKQIIELVKTEKVKRCLDGSAVLLDDNYPLLRIQNGKRGTAYQPKTYLSKIYFFGSCHHYGTNAPFDKTIESYLQQMLNEANLPYCVENESQHFAGRYQDIFYNLNKLKPAPGDIIFFWITNLRSNDNIIPFCDVSNAFDPPHDYREIYCRQDHVNELGYKLVAEKYFDFLTANNFFRDIELKYPPPQSTCPPFWYTATI